MFCDGLSGRRRQIRYLDVLKDFGFMEAKGFDVGFIHELPWHLPREDLVSSRGKNVEI